MKKTVYLVTILFLMLGMVSPAVAGPAADDPQPDPNLPAVATKVYLPLVMTPTYYTVSGRITDDQPTFNAQLQSYVDDPLVGVAVRSSSGETALTDSQGRYSLTVIEGSTVAPEGSSQYFYPSEVQVDANATNINFTGSTAGLAPSAPNAQVIPNSDFEVVPYYWNRISGGAAGYTPSYTNIQHRSGLISMVTGFYYNWYDYQQSISGFRTHELTIPNNATQASLEAWMLPISEEPGALAQPTKGDQPALPAELQALIGHSTDEPNLPAWTQDFTYIAVLNPWNNYIERFVYAQLRNDPAWISSGVISLLAEKGRTIKLEFGTINDGDGWDTHTYFDDITLDVITGMANCTNILLDPQFELNNGSWTWNAPQNVPPVWTTQYWWSPTHSNKAGLAPADAKPGYDSTTEFYQPFTIPANATYAMLTTRVRPVSNWWWGWWSDEAKVNLETPKVSDWTLGPSAPNQQTSQYGFIANPGGTQGIWMLFKWFALDSASWYSRSYNLLNIRGLSLSVLFGAGNVYNYAGDPVKNALYVDDTYLNVCTP